MDGTPRLATPKGLLNSWWESLKPIRRDKRIGPAVSEAFAWLWVQLDGRPGYLTITAHELGAQFSKSARAADKWLTRLCETDYVEIIARDGSGAIRVYVHDPSEVDRPRPAKHDPQRPLNGFEDDCQEPRPEPPDTIRAADLSAPKGPSLPGDLFTPKGPSESPKMPAFPGKGPQTSDLSAPKGPSPSMDTIEGLPRIPPSSHRTPPPMDHGKRPHKQRDPESNPGPEPVARTLAQMYENLDRVADPQIQKQRLVDEIKQTIRDPNMHPSIPGRAADHVVNGEIPVEDLKAILRDIHEIRRMHGLGRGKGFKEGPAQFFLFKVRQWPCWREPKGRPNE